MEEWHLLRKAFVYVHTRARTRIPIFSWEMNGRGSV